MKRIVITGCTKGLGRALSEYFIAEGHVVCGCGRNLREVNTLSNKYPFPHFFAKVDVRDDAAVHRWANHCLEKGPAPDLLINNAAVIAKNAPLWELSASEADAVFDTNIKGVVNVLRHFLPFM
ncbi:MAG: SDR family NAD(P)-dependent oxidoreductase, partial [Gemmataceae bacterium]|nr:SDR family NAD(P)-dependent oxidoreductase [Gemmataceae bacterium]MDW8244900.1 SDR family NAD(P)-dependent oxidoreductase [Thermogemmata sp.]